MDFNDRRKSMKQGAVERAVVHNVAAQMEKENPFVSRKERYASAARSLDVHQQKARGMK